MEGTILQSCVRVGQPAAFISQRCRASSHVKNVKSSNFPSNSKCSSTNINKLIIQPVGLHGIGESRFSKPLLFGRNYIRGCTKLELSGSDPVLGKDQPESAATNFVARVLRFGSTIYTFSRPYTMTHLFVASVSLFARVLVDNIQLFKWSLLFKAFSGLIAMILATIYSNGINQVFDVDIDRLNKPFLPIPAGDLSLNQARFLVIFSAFAGQLILWLMNADLITTCCFSFCLLFTTLYSAPPFRMKRSSLATAILMLLMSTSHHFGLLYATTTSLGVPFRWSPLYVFIVTFAALFFAVTTIVKDISDVEGDKKHNIQTFAVMFGPKNIAFLGTGILMITYIGAIAAAIYLPQAFRRYLMLSTHSIFALWLLFQLRRLDKVNYGQEASQDFYQFIWKLITLEFLLFPLM